MTATNETLSIRQLIDVEKHRSARSFFELRVDDARPSAPSKVPASLRDEIALSEDAILLTRVRRSVPVEREDDGARVLSNVISLTKGADEELFDINSDLPHWP